MTLINYIIISMQIMHNLHRTIMCSIHIMRAICPFQMSFPNALAYAAIYNVFYNMLTTYEYNVFKPSYPTDSTICQSRHCNKNLLNIGHLNKVLDLIIQTKAWHKIFASIEM